MSPLTLNGLNMRSGSPGSETVILLVSSEDPGILNLCLMCYQKCIKQLPPRTVLKTDVLHIFSCLWLFSSNFIFCFMYSNDFFLHCAQWEVFLALD